MTVTEITNEVPLKPYIHQNLGIITWLVVFFKILYYFLYINRLFDPGGPCNRTKKINEAGLWQVQFKNVGQNQPIEMGGKSDE